MRQTMIESHQETLRIQSSKPPFGVWLYLVNSRHFETAAHKTLNLSLFTPTYSLEGVYPLCTYVCLRVCVCVCVCQHSTTKTTGCISTDLDRRIVHDKTWSHILFEVKRLNVKVTWLINLMLRSSSPLCWFSYHWSMKLCC